MVAARSSQPRRSVVLAHGTYYDAASTTPLRDFGSYPSVYEDFMFTGPTRAQVLGRLRREVRNNEYLAGLVGKFPEAMGTSDLRSRTTSLDYNAAHDLLWYRWSKHAGADGASLAEMEAIINHELLIAGEVFIILLANGKLQLVPSEFCGSPFQGRMAGEINGIVYSDRNRPLSYRFGRMNETGVVDHSQSELISARYVVHVWRRDRVLQGRGLPWLLSCLRPARDLQEITVAKTKQIKDASKISGTIEKEGAAHLLDQWGRPVAEALGTEDATTVDLDSAADGGDRGPVVVELKDGTFIALEPGEKLKMLTTQYHASDYKELVMLMLHAISSPVGLPVELWFSGLGDVNYSGFKGLGTQWNARRQFILGLLQTRYLDRIHLWKVSKARAELELPENPDQDDDLYDLRWRRTPVLDDEREAKKIKARLDCGADSLNDVWEQEGRYAEEVLSERRELYIKLILAAGEIAPGSDTTALKVPLEFLLRGILASELKNPPPAPAADPAGPPTDTAQS
jgi:capsid protein